MSISLKHLKSSSRIKGTLARRKDQFDVCYVYLHNKCMTIGLPTKYRSGLFVRFVVLSVQKDVKCK